MCDTFVALGNATADGSVLLAKNSDREPNEAHEICVLPAASYAEGAEVQCTYLRIPQARHTHAVLLAKPFWIWGAEMGINEHGVAIGNEAIFTRVSYETGPGLIGMDFLRLALERADTAWNALYTITDLLEKYGQGGNCGFTHPFYYHNSFLIADTKEAWVLETAGKQWAAEKVQSVRSISNAATIGNRWDLSSDDLVHYAVDRGWCRGRDDFHFARCYSDFTYTTFSDARRRQSCTTRLLDAAAPTLNPGEAMRILRAHANRSPKTPPARLDHALLGATVCMHAGAGPVRGSQSVGSLVAHLTAGLPTAWVTGTSAPCTGIFKPLWLDSGYPLQEPSPSGRYDPACLWWRHERLHRAVLRDYAPRMAAYAADRDHLEEGFLRSAAAVASSCAARAALSAQCFQSAERAEQEWQARVDALPLQGRSRFYYQRAWKTWDAQAGLVVETMQK